MACDKYRCLKCNTVRCVTRRMFQAGGSRSTAYLPAPTVCFQFTHCSTAAAAADDNAESQELLLDSGIASLEAFGGCTIGGGEELSFPLVSGFTFTQYSNELFEYNWDTFAEEDRVIALEFSLDEGETWSPFTTINPNDEGPILYAIADVDGFDGEGGTFLVNDFYYMRARFQDQAESPTVVGDWTEVFFQAENIQEADFPDVENFVFQQVDSTDFEYNWQSFTSDRVIYIETSWDGVSWDFFTWVDHTETGPYGQTAWTMGGWPEVGNDFVPGNTYYMRVRYQDQYPDPTLIGNFVELSFVAV